MSEAFIRTDLASIPAYVPGKNLPGALKLASNETIADPLPSVQAEIARAAQGINRYPDAGATRLRERLAAHLGLPADWVATGCGSVALCHQLALSTCKDGDEVVFAWRSFEVYPIIAQVAGARAVTVPLTADFRHDLPALAAAVTARTKLVFLCSPNNPTGTAITATEFAEFMAAVPETVLVALDEAYIEYLRDAAGAPGIVATEAVHRYPNLVVLRTFSKAYGLAGLRLGYAFGRPEIIQALDKVSITFATNSLAQAAGLASLEAQAELLSRTEAIVSERVRVRVALQQIGYVVPESQANFVWLATGADTADIARLCQEQGVILRAFATDGIRMTVTNREEDDRALAALREAFAQVKEPKCGAAAG